MWTYQQSTGRFSHNGVLVGVGYSGHQEHANRPEDEQLHGLGPIPRGLYTMQNWRDDVHKGPCVCKGPCVHKGPCVCDLIPDATNQMFGRSGFMLHGDNAAGDHSASEGCIIQRRPVREQARQFAEAGDNRLEVIE